MLFYFETCPIALQNPDSDANIKKLEHSLEDQIYHMLRKNRIVTNIRYIIAYQITLKLNKTLKLFFFAFSSNSLFAIPANQEFVYVHTGNTDSKDMLGFMARKLMQSCKTSSGGTTSRSLTSLDSNSIVTDETGKMKMNGDQIKNCAIYTQR